MGVLIKTFLLVATCQAVLVRSFQHSSFIPSSGHLQSGKTESDLQRIGRVYPTAVLASKESEQETQKSRKTGKFPKLDIPEADEDPGIKVTATAWKWPSKWPYTDDYFDVISQLPDPEFFQKKETGEKSFFKPESEDLLKAHLARFIPENAKILDLGAGSNSYLPSPDTVTIDKVVGMAIEADPMEKNSRLSERIVQDLNQETTLPFEDESLDVVLISNSVEFFTNPLELFREIFRVLKVEGRVIMTFTGAGEYNEFEDKKIKLWRTMNDAQHMWICGSYCKFSADLGFGELKGYELTPEQNLMEKALTNIQRVFVVQAKKYPPISKEEDIELYLFSQMSSADEMLVEEKKLVAARLAAGYNRATTEEEKLIFEEAGNQADSIYKVLKQIPDDVVAPALKAKCAAMLAPKYDGSELMQNMLEQGLGISSPSESFWVPLGNMTTGVGAEDKIMLIAELVPYLGGSLEQQNAAEEMMTLLPDLIALIKEKCPEWEEGDCQLVATDLLITDYLNADDESRSTFTDWTQKLSVGALEVFLDQRKNYKST